MRSEFENSIKWSSSYEKLVYQHGERLFIFDDGKYKIAAVQLAWELWEKQQSKVDELQKRVDEQGLIIAKVMSIASELQKSWAMFEIGKRLEQALKGGEE